MRGSGAHRPRLSDILYDRHGKSRALNGVCSRAKLVKEDERAFVFLLHYRNYIHHMRGEGGKRLLNALLVAKVYKYLFLNTERRALVSGDMKSRLRHYRKQTKGFKSYRLSSSVRSCDYKRVVFAAEIYVYRHDGALVDKGMPCASEVYASFLCHYRLTAVHAP